MNIRFAIASDLHIALPETIEDKPNRFQLTQYSTSALDAVLNHLNTLNLDFLLLPGDLTQDGEAVNHQWLQEKLTSLPYPVYVIPGNHDIPYLNPPTGIIRLKEFANYYAQCGYQNCTDTLDYTLEVAPNLQLIALNSNYFDEEGKQQGGLLPSQLIWLEDILSSLGNKVVMVMIHHNVIEHLPHQSKHPLGRRYILDNCGELLDILVKYNVKLIFTGHLHIQDVSKYRNIYEITTGSLVTYPSPYRVLELEDDEGELSLSFKSHHVVSLPEKADYQSFCREWMGGRSFPFIMKLLTSPPLNLSEDIACQYAPIMRNFWGEIAKGDSEFNYPELPSLVNQHFQQFGVNKINGIPQFIDNKAKLTLV